MECMTGSSLARLGPVVHEWAQSCKDLNARLGPVGQDWTIPARLDPVL